MRARRGFTLLEAIVGVAIATAFVGAIAVFASNLGDTRARLGRAAAELETADAVFAEVERACATAVVDDVRLGAGISGNESSVSLVRCAVGLGEGRDELLSDRSVVRVEFDGARGRIALGRGSLRDELPAAVRAMRVRYLADDGWVDAFDSAEHGAFPALVEVAIWF
ncbi:MAG: PulJ/GspJ family protein, partial [Phycisphaerales bacterium]